jgi:hypothetical protein
MDKSTPNCGIRLSEHRVIIYLPLAQDREQERFTSESRQRPDEGVDKSLNLGANARAISFQTPQNWRRGNGS